MECRPREEHASFGTPLLNAAHLPDPRCSSGDATSAKPAARRPWVSIPGRPPLHGKYCAAVVGSEAVNTRAAAAQATDMPNTTAHPISPAPMTRSSSRSGTRHFGCGSKARPAPNVRAKGERGMTLRCSTVELARTCGEV